MFEDFSKYTEFDIKNGVLREYRDSTKEKVQIPDGVTSIGKKAFWGCSKLKQVRMPSRGLTSIGEGAFEGCISLRNVSFSVDLASIGEDAFVGCAFRDIKLPEIRLSYIGARAFNLCKELTSIKIPEGVSKIPEWAFSGCESLHSVFLPDSVREIGACAFRNCTQLTEINIPKNVTEIQSGTFANCERLFQIELPDSVKIIRKQAFANCKDLCMLSIPNGIKNIETDAFVGCDSLGDIIKPEDDTNVKKSSIKFASTVLFGKQDWKSSKEEWRVIREEKDRLLLVGTPFVFQNLPMDTSIDRAFEAVRKKLNESFCDSFFSDEEMEHILIVENEYQVITFKKDELGFSRKKIGMEKRRERIFPAKYEDLKDLSSRELYRISGDSNTTVLLPNSIGKNLELPLITYSDGRIHKDSFKIGSISYEEMRENVDNDVCTYSVIPSMWVDINAPYKVV